MKVLLLEQDRIIATCIRDELKTRGADVASTTSADKAIIQADTETPDAVVVELSLPGHSGTEFLYEFRTYPEWEHIPIILYSSLQPSKTIVSSRDWQLLTIYQSLYKPKHSIQDVASAVESALDKS